MPFLYENVLKKAKKGADLYYMYLKWKFFHYVEVIS